VDNACKELRNLNWGQIVPPRVQHAARMVMLIVGVSIAASEVGR
jgi:hypothetical protein